MRLAACLAAALALATVTAGAEPVAAPALGPASAKSSFGHYQPPKAYTEQVRSSFYLPLRDGTRLAVTVARPARDGKPVEARLPVIWHHTLSATQEAADGTGPRAGRIPFDPVADRSWLCRGAGRAARQWPVVRHNARLSRPGRSPRCL